MAEWKILLAFKGEDGVNEPSQHTLPNQSLYICILTDKSWLLSHDSRVVSNYTVLALFAFNYDFPPISMLELFIGI